MCCEIIDEQCSLKSKYSKDNPKALECLKNCYLGNGEKVKKWLDNEAPNENDDMDTKNMFSYLVKMHCYLQTGQYMLTVILAKKLLEFLKLSDFPYEKCECHIMIAMACYEAGDKKRAVEELDKAFEIALNHHYVHLFSDEGQVMMDLMKLYKRKANSGEVDKAFYDEKYVAEIRMEATKVAEEFPAYLV